MFAGDGPFMWGSLVIYKCYFVFLICLLLNHREFHLKVTSRGWKKFRARQTVGFFRVALSALLRKSDFPLSLKYGCKHLYFFFYPLRTDSSERMQLLNAEWGYAPLKEAFGHAEHANPWDGLVSLYLKEKSVARLWRIGSILFTITETNCRHLLWDSEI